MSWGRPSGGEGRGAQSGAERSRPPDFTRPERVSDTRASLRLARVLQSEEALALMIVLRLG